VTNAVITADPGRNETEDSGRAIDENAYGFWIYERRGHLRVAISDLCSDVAQHR
jgi:hypothetical protein